MLSLLKLHFIYRFPLTFVILNDAANDSKNVTHLKVTVLGECLKMITIQPEYKNIYTMQNIFCNFLCFAS